MHSLHVRSTHPRPQRDLTRAPMRADTSVTTASSTLLSFIASLLSESLPLYLSTTGHSVCLLFKGPADDVPAADAPHDHVTLPGRSVFGQAVLLLRADSRVGAY